MIAMRDVFGGPWRAVPVLGVTQIIAWGSIYYTPVLVLPRIAAERGWSISFVMGGFSAGLLAAGLSAPYVGRSIDRFGGHVTMTAGSLIGALGLALMTQAADRIGYYAVWMVLGLAMAANLYDAAFATLGRIFGAAARRPITMLTLAGGFASTVSWPATHVLLESIGWRGVYLVYAALFACVSAPLHALMLPRGRADVWPARSGQKQTVAKVLPPYGLPFTLLAAAFSSYAFVPSGLSAHLLAIFTRSGIDPSAVVWIGALFGPAQVGARLIEFTFSGGLHPLWVARFALSALLCAFVVLLLFGVSLPMAAVFAVVFGGANGLITITRGALPLALFGAWGYGHVIGRLAAPWLFMQAVAPLLMALMVEGASDSAALALAGSLTALAFMCFALIKMPD